MASDTISPLTAVLWVFYPMAALVLIELILRAINDDDDDEDGGKGARDTSDATSSCSIRSIMDFSHPYCDSLNDGMVV